MPQVIEKNSIMTAKEPMVILPLEKWEKIEDTMDELECAFRYYKALVESKDDKTISLEAVRKKYNLR